MKKIIKKHISPYPQGLRSNYIGILELYLIGKRTIDSQVAKGYLEYNLE